MKKVTFIAFLLIISSSAFAQFREDIIIQREIAPEYAKIVVAENYMREENQKLPKANSNMANKLLSSINTKFLRGIHIDKDDDMNTIYLSGEIKGAQSLKYQISRNLINTYAAYSVIKGKLDKNNLFDSIQDLNGNNLAINKVRVEKFRDEYFLVYTDKEDAKTFIEGNIGNQINIQIQSTGEEHEARARDFLKSLSFSKLEDTFSTSGYTVSLEENEEKINERSKDTKHVKKIFSGF